MYTMLAGGKDESVKPSTFLPSWWFDRDVSDPEEVDMAAKRAKFLATFGLVDAVSGS